MGKYIEMNHLDVVWFSARSALLATILILPAGIFLAWALARREWVGKSVVETIITLPLVMPPVATGLVLLRVLGRRGIIGSWLHEALHLDIVFTWRGVVIAMAVMSFPLLVRSVRVAFEEVDRRLEQVAYSLGARPLRVFATVTLPLARRGIVSGMLLAFARAVGEFGATILVAGNIPGKTSTLSVSIYQYIQLGKDHYAFELVLVSVALAFCAVWLSDRFSVRKKYESGN
jgi:molybdate transport system permease protein